LMALDLAEAPSPAPGAPSVAVRRVTTDREFAEFARVTTVAFEGSHDARIEELRSRISDPAVAMFVADVDGEPASAGRVELPAGASIAGLWGGGTVPRLRHRGVYRALVAARTQYARAHGFRHVIVEAAATSRPILERLGFTALDRVTGWNSPSGVAPAAP
jgi:GNAT superfamily N-acetyltransferase